MSTGRHKQNGRVTTAGQIIHTEPKGLLEATRSGAAAVKTTHFIAAVALILHQESTALPSILI